MQPSTWNSTNQHWIPQFLLKGFGIKGRASQVYELDKQSRDIRIRAVDDVASKQRLLTERDDELMKAIESRSTLAIGRIRKGDLSIQQDDRQALNTLVFAMMRNDPRSGFNEARTREEITSDLSNEIAEAFARQGGLVDLQDLKDFIGERFGHDYLNVTLGMGHNLALKALELMGLRVHEPVEGEVFTIGDSPVLVVRGTVGAYKSLLHPGSQVILPIHSRRVLVYSWETPMNLIQPGDALSRDQVRSLARDYYHESNSRYIFGRNRGSLKHARMPQIPRSSGTRPAGVSDGWRVMQEELLRVSRSREETDKAHRKELDAFARELVIRARQDVENQARDHQ